MARPTLDEVRTWPATVDVTLAALALGISKSTAYDAIRAGEFPGKVLTVRRRKCVVTASLLEVLSALP